MSASRTPCWKTATLLDREGRRVLIAAPYGRDAETLAGLLAQKDCQPEICADMEEVARRLDERAGLVLVAEEALIGDPAPLRHALGRQPIWSEIPFVLLAGRQGSRQQRADLARGRLPPEATNVVVLERPLGAESLLSAAESALRARRRQFEMRDRLAEIARAAETLEQKVAERTAQLREELARREQVEAALRQSQKMEAIGHLTGGIAHDFNNMLTGVIGSIDLVRRRMATGRFEGLDRYMQAAWTSAQRAASLTQRLLAFSRRQSLDARPLSVNDLVQDLAELLERSINERITLKLEPGEGLPAAVADANQLESALLNLVINARDAMPDGGTLTVSTRMVEITGEEATPDLAPGRYVAVTVADTGVGMEPSVAEQVFEPFFTTKPTGQGTGLGLSMVYGFARQSGGTARLRSRVGEGTAVEILLPVSDVTPDADAAPLEPAPDGQGQQVLLVEDDDAVRLLVSSVLDELGYAVIEVADPRLAAPILESDRPVDLMVSDVGLPGMNGRQLAEIARRHRPDLPILFVTGYAENAAIRSSFLGRNMDMITKPFSLDVLSAKISEMLQPAA
ncbi:MAG: response regulator [Proteobacteria bacterium]|nr:response regulator [Pseudomonadota bacterium]